MPKLYRWYVIAMLWCVCFLNYADRQAIFALFPLLQVEFHLTNLQLALVGSSFMWAYALFGPVAGWLGDRLSRKWLILAGLIFWLFVTAATIVAHQFWQLAILRGLNGIAEAVYFPAAMSLISSYHNAATRSRAMSLHQSAVYAGSIGGGVVASWLGEHFGWRTNFICFGALGVILCIILILFLREPYVEQSFKASSAAKPRAALNEIAVNILGYPPILRLIVAFIGANFVAMVFMVWLPTFLYGKFNLTLAMAGMNATLYLQLASVAGVLAGGAIADSFASRYRGGRMRTQVIGLLIGMPFLVLAGQTLSLSWFIFAMIGFGFAKGIYESNIWAALYDVVHPHQQATAVGVMNSLGWLGGGLAPLAIAFGSQHFGMGICLSSTSLVYGCVAGLLLWNTRTALPRKVQREQLSES